MNSAINTINLKDNFIAAGRIVSRETLGTIGNILKDAHKPITIDYLGKFGLSELPLKEEPQPEAVKEEVASYQGEKKQHVCSKCDGRRNCLR